MEKSKICLHQHIMLYSGSILIEKNIKNMNNVLSVLGLTVMPKPGNGNHIRSKRLG